MDPQKHIFTPLTSAELSHTSCASLHSRGEPLKIDGQPLLHFSAVIPKSNYDRQSHLIYAKKICGGCEYY